MDSRLFFPRPRGRGRKGHYWDERKGAWIRDTCNGYASSSLTTLSIQKHHRAFNVTTTHMIEERENRHKAEEEANARRFMEEHRLQEIEKRKEEEEQALQEAQAKRDAELRKKMRFMQPHNAAFEIYGRTNKRIPVYWLDSLGNFYQCPAQPYTKPDSNQHERSSYIWNTKTMDKIVTYKDDPVTLAEGEWEYRRVSVTYKSYV